MREELTAVVQEVDHRDRLVQDHHRGRSQTQAAKARWIIEIQAAVKLVAPQQPHADAARDCGLRLATLPDPAPELINQLLHGQTQRRFITTGPLNMSTQAIQLGSKTARITRILGVGWYTDRAEPIDASIQNVFDACHRLDVVDHGRLAKGPFHGRKRRLDPRPGPLPLETLDQARLFTTDIRPGAAMQEDIERILRAANVLAQQAGCIALVHRRLHAPIGQRILVTQIEIRRRGARRVAAE